jgi:uncharacterized membrane protein YdjX (TVP38/TMEM64 family)
LAPELDEDGKPRQSGGKIAVSLTAFAVAAGAVALRIGGRAALISAVGLDFANDNPQLKEQLDNILNYADSLDPVMKALMFVAAWTAVKVFCVDAGGVALALSAGILFGGVIQGAVFSAAAATIGSAVCFALAKLDTPVRKKALEVVDEFPSLRGIEKVVAQDGFKAILTLRLAPILPIPIGLYNYVYGVTNVPFVDFAAGIFLGSLKPYLLDSYLGYFGKSIVDGSAAKEAFGIQDVLLLTAIGFSVLIGVFASQLAGETWDTVLAEVEAEKNEKAGKVDDDVDDGIIRKFFGISLPDWLVGFQLQMFMAEERIGELIDVELDAKVWNYTKADGGPPQELDPAYAANSPELAEVNTGFDFASSTCDGLVLTPLLLSTFLKVADPYFDEVKERSERPDRRKFRDMLLTQQDWRDSIMKIIESEPEMEADEVKAELLEKIEALRTKTRDRLDKLEQKLNGENAI